MDKDQLYKIIKLGRFHFLTAGFLTFTSGALLAGILTGKFFIEKFIFAYLILMPAHLSVSYSNDYFDWKADHYIKPNLFTGGSGVLVKNPQLRNMAKKIALYLIFSSIAMAIIYSIIYESPSFLLLVVFGNLLGWYYSAPPLKLSYRGLGEVAMVLTGLIIPGLGYLAMAGFIDIKFLLFSIPQMIYQVVFILSVELPDRIGDKKAGKNTFTVKYGVNASILIILISTLLGMTLFILLGLTHIYNPINFNIILIFSFIPFLTSLWGYRNRFKIEYVKFTKYMVTSLIILILLLDIYFLLIITNTI
ncbi:MAG: prenyltransferase [Methanobacteriaceae archaeon]|nr:prenyltransferase [Methanobacteriaceae archaeon]